MSGITLTFPSIGVRHALILCLLSTSQVSAGPTLRHRVEKVETLGSIAKRVYGSEHYAGLLALHDDIEAEKLQVGAQIETPPLLLLVESEKLGPRAPPAQDLVEASLALKSVEPRLWLLVGKQRAADASDQEVLITASNHARHAAEFLAQWTPSPKAAVGQAKRATELLTKLAENGPDDYGYDITDAHRRLAYALEYWIRDSRAR